MNDIATTASLRAQHLGAMSLTPLNGTFGARVEGVQIASCGKDDIEAIQNALDQYRVLVFRDQHELDPSSLLRFSKHFGQPETAPHPTHPDFEGVPGVKVLESDAGVYPQNVDTWHTDGPARANRHWISLLQAISVPPYGRDTMFADMVSAFNRLSPPIQALLEGLTCAHSWGRQHPEAAEVSHPMVVENKRTGDKALYVNKLYTRRIEGLRDDESDALLSFLLQQTKMPEVQLRVNWEPGTVVLWDNEVTQHYLVLDMPFPRVMHRVMVTPN